MTITNSCGFVFKMGIAIVGFTMIRSIKSFNLIMKQVFFYVQVFF